MKSKRQKVGEKIRKKMKRKLDEREKEICVCVYIYIYIYIKREEGIDRLNGCISKDNETLKAW